MRPPRRIRPARNLAATAVVVLCCLGVVGAPAPAPAAAVTGPFGPCPGSTGVTVVVDFQGQGDLDVVVKCAPGQVSSGFDALAQAGFSVDPTLRSPGFLCRIDGQPANDACVVPSPTTAYWSYWSADRGGPWVYRTDGGATSVPAQGSVEGWSFSLNRSQANAPPPRSETFGAKVAPAPAPPAVVTPPAQVGAATTLAPPGPVQSPGTGAASLPGVVTEPPPSTAVPASTVPAVPNTTNPDPATGDPADDDSADAADESDSAATEDGESYSEVTEDGEEAASTVDLAESGRGGRTSPLGAGVALGVMGALGAAAVVVNRRRFASVPESSGES